MKKVKKRLLFVILLVLALALPVQAQAAVKISKKSVTLIKGQSVTLKITGTSKKATWSSSKKAVASVTSKGKVTAKGNGTATITAKIGKKKYTCKVKVENPKISTTKLTLTKGKTATLKVSGTSQKISWKSSNKKIATVTSKGIVKGIKTGSCKITATIGKKKYTCTVIVKAATSSYKTYGENTYRVGSTIPAGQYALFTTSTISGYFQISSDSTGSLSSIVANDNFDYNSIITVKKGQYLKLDRCKAVPIAFAKISPNADGGMYRVGIDIKPGEYMLKTTSAISGYYEVSSSDSHSVFDIITNDNFNGTAYITVENGQYLKLSRCKMSKYRKI